MKFKTITQLTVTCISIFIAAGLYAQSSTTNPEIFEKTTLLISPKSDAAADKLVLDKMKAESPKMFRDFSKNFRGASEIQSTVGDDEYTFIYCKVDGIVNRIVYDPKGRWQRTVRSYGENDLATDVREKVTGAFPAFSIFNVTEVQAQGKKAYLIQLENKKFWRIVRVVEDEIEGYKEYSKL